jgi:hypothetical protein
MRAGADLVAVGTESFRDPAAGLRIAAELTETLANGAITQRLSANSAFPGH